MDWVLSFLVLAGNFLLARKIKWGWVVMMANSLAWIYYALGVLDPQQFGLVPSAAINFVLSVMGAWKWFKEDAS